VTEVIKGWIQAAAETLDTNPEVVAVWLAAARTLPGAQYLQPDLRREWRMGSVGTTLSFGGDVIRAEAARRLRQQCHRCRG